MQLNTRNWNWLTRTVKSLLCRVNALEAIAAVDSQYLETNLLLDLSTDSAPSQVTEGTDYLRVDITDHNGTDTSLTGYAPSGLKSGAKVRVTKANNSSYKITFTDPLSGIYYDFVDTEGEFFTFVWNGTALYIE